MLKQMKVFNHQVNQNSVIPLKMKKMSYCKAAVKRNSLISMILIKRDF